MLHLKFGVYSLKRSSDTNVVQTESRNSCRSRAAAPRPRLGRHCGRWPRRVGAPSSRGLMTRLLFLHMAALALPSWHGDDWSNETLALGFINGRIPSTHKSGTSKRSIPCGGEVIQLISETVCECVLACLSCRSVKCDDVQHCSALPTARLCLFNL